MSHESSKHEETIKISDKRRFNAEGETKDAPKNQDAQTENARKENAEDHQAAEAQAAFDAASLSDAKRETTRLPKIDFSAFVLSLSHNAMMFLEDHEDQKANLPMAKQMIDIIDMLKKKTQGNLEHEEERFLQAVLFDLQMRYLERKKQAG